MSLHIHNHSERLNATQRLVAANLVTKHGNFNAARLGALNARIEHHRQSLARLCETEYQLQLDAHEGGIRQECDGYVRYLRHVPEAMQSSIRARKACHQHALDVLELKRQRALGEELKQLMRSDQATIRGLDRLLADITATPSQDDGESPLGMANPVH